MEERLGGFNITGARLRCPATTHAGSGKIPPPGPCHAPVHFRDRDDCFRQSEQAPTPIVKIYKAAGPTFLRHRGIELLLSQRTKVFELPPR